MTIKQTHQEIDFGCLGTHKCLLTYEYDSRTDLAKLLSVVWDDLEVFPLLTLHSVQELEASFEHSDWTILED